jgi:hypothetical protein
VIREKLQQSHSQVFLYDQLVILNHLTYLFNKYILLAYPVPRPGDDGDEFPSLKVGNYSYLGTEGSPTQSPDIHTESECLHPPQIHKFKS